jgi:cyclopropane fatty-acyl-phospholipid synthase-like methyltransferase
VATFEAMTKPAKKDKKQKRRFYDLEDVHLVRNFFIDFSVTYDREERAEEALDALELLGHNPSQGTLLDLGCGRGRMTKWFSKRLDVYSIGLEVCAAFANEGKAHDPKVEYLLASGINLPFREKTFHTVILNDVLEHVSYQNALELFRQIRTALDDKGRLYVSVASKFEIIEPHSGILFMSWFPRWVYSPVVRRIFHDDVYPYTFGRFKRLAEKTGFHFKDVTCLYVLKKVQNLNYIGNVMLRPVVQLLNKLGLTRIRGFLKFLEPFGVLIFVCRKQLEKRTE